MRKLPFAALLFLQCARSEPPPPRVVVLPPQPPQRPAAPASAPAPPPRMANARLLVLGGRNRIVNAAWLGDTVAAASRTDLWTVKPEEPERVHRVALAAPLGSYGVVTASDHLVAIGLEDGTVDVFGESGRKRTLPAGAKVHAILSLRFSPDEKTLAVTRNGPTWKEETTFYDVETGSVRGKIDGGKVVFDPTSKYVAGRGGVASLDGKTIYKWGPGFLVMERAGHMIDIGASHGEVVAADIVARGWNGSLAYYAGDKEVVLVDPTRGKTTSIPATCGSPTKLMSEADSTRKRVIGVCAEGVVITDLDARTSSLIAIPIQRRNEIFPPTVTLLENTSTFLVHGSGASAVVVDAAGHAHPASPGEQAALNAAVFQCVSRYTARRAIACDMPAARKDGAFMMTVAEQGLHVIDTRTGRAAIDWGSARDRGPATNAKGWAYHAGAFEVRDRSTRRLAFRLDGQPPTKDAGEPFPPDGCGKAPDASGWFPTVRTDDFAAYSTIRAAGGRVTAHVVCTCSAGGCEKMETADDPIAADGDGAVLTTATNATMTESTITLRRPKQPTVRTKLPYSCIYGTFAPGHRVYVACRDDQRALVLEISSSSLAVIGKRVADEGGEIDRAGDELAYGSGESVAFLPLDWAKDSTRTEVATGIYAGAFAARLGHDGTLQIAGDESAAAEVLRCYDGEYLRPLSACR